MPAQNYSFLAKYIKGCCAKKDMPNTNYDLI